MEALQEELRYNCKKCEAKFATRNEMASHIYHEHVKPNHKPKQHVIPREFIPELRFIGNSGYVSVTCEGPVDKNGITVERFKYNR